MTTYPRTRSFDSFRGAITWVFVALSAMTFYVIGAGENALSDNIDVSNGLDSLGSRLGGLFTDLWSWDTAALIGALLAAATIVFGLLYMTNHEYVRNSQIGLRNAHIALGFALFLLAGYLIIAWVPLAAIPTLLLNLLYVLLVLAIPTVPAILVGKLWSGRTR